jgi:hypothetical protein
VKSELDVDFCFLFLPRTRNLRISSWDGAVQGQLMTRNDIARDTTKQRQLLVTKLCGVLFRTLSLCYK